MKKRVIVALLIVSSYMSAMNNGGTSLSPRRQIRSLPVGAGSGLGNDVQRMILGSVGSAAGQVVVGAMRGMLKDGVSGEAAGVRFQIGGRRSSEESDSGALRRSTSHDHLSTPRDVGNQEVKPRAQASAAHPVPRLKISSAEHLATRSSGGGNGSRKNRSRSGSSGSEKDNCDPKTREHEQHVAGLQQQIGVLIQQLNISPGELAGIQDLNRSRSKKEKDRRFQDCKNLEAIIALLAAMVQKNEARVSLVDRIRRAPLDERSRVLGLTTQEDFMQATAEQRTRLFGFMTENELRQTLLYMASGVALSIASGATNRAVSAAGNSCSIQ